jgi:ribonuclease G
VQELHVERTLESGLVGNVYLGKVARVLPGMQSAFIDIGLERAAFLHVADLHGSGSPTASRRPQRQPQPQVPIEKQVFEGQPLMVQVIKDPIGTKGARLSTQISIAGRLLVFLPQDDHIGVSQKIPTDQRDACARRLQRWWARTPPAAGAASSCAPTARTPATPSWPRTSPTCARPGSASRTPRCGCRRRLAAAPGPEPAAARAARPGDGADADHPARFARAVRHAAGVRRRVHAAGGGAKLQLYKGERPIFDLFNIDEEIAKALGRRVDLKSGGYLIVDQTEALTTVDVNTGGYVGARNFDDTIFKTNLEAAHAIARQLRLRNLGGIIIVDFIDMQREDHREQVLAEFRKQLARDRVKTMSGGFSQLGLVEMTRKRTRESLAHMLCEPCPACQGKGRCAPRARWLRHPARDPARGAPVQPARVPRGRVAQGDRAVPGRGKPAPGRPVRLHRQADLAAERERDGAGAVRHRAVVGGG